jgi:hypothetical protein
MARSHQPNKPEGKIPRGIVGLLLAFIILAFAYSVVNPIHEATDELRHYRFARIIATTGRLPVQGQEPCRSQSHHPPLFYALGALATAWIDTGQDICDQPAENPFWAYRYWEVGRDNKNQYLHGLDEAFPWSGEALAAHIIRGINILIGAGVVLLTWATGRAIWPDRPAIALGAAAIVGFNPMFLYLSGAINNDVIAAFSGSAAVFACVLLLANPKRLNWRWGIWLGLLYGLALMSKFNLAVIILLIEAALTWAVLKKPYPDETRDPENISHTEDHQIKGTRGGRVKQWITINAILFLVAGLVAGWWFVRNQLLFGEPTGFQELTELWGVRDPRESFGLAISELPYAWTTLWGRFGFGQIPLPEAIYAGLKVFTALGLIGAILGFLRRATANERIILIFLAADVLLFSLVLFNYMLVSPAGPNGRFFFPGLSALALLVFYGLSQLVSIVQAAVLNAIQLAEGKANRAQKEAKALNYLAVGTALGMSALAVLVLFGYLRPAYARPPELDQSAEIPHPVEAHFDNLVTLLGYDISPPTLRPGEALDVELYWEVNARPPGDYLLFVHLMDEAQTMVAQRDTHPGLGSFPSSQWRPGDRFVDKIRVQIPETAYAPVTAGLSVGLYDPEAYRLAVFDEDDQLLGDAVELATVELLAPEGKFPNPQDQNFNDELRLVGYEFDKREATEGQSIQVDLYWEALQSLDADYLVQVRLVGEDGKIWATDDGRPAGENSPTNTWNEGDVIKDTHFLRVEPGTPEGRYPVVVSLIDADIGWQPSIVAEDGHLIDTHLKLAQIRVFHNE